MKRNLILAILILMTVAASSKAATFTYKDKLGRTISLKTPVNRAIFFETYEIIAALDVWEKVVGIASYAYDNDLIKAVKPDIKKIPPAGFVGQINIEVILKQKPDVIVIWTWKPENIKFMEEKGLTVIGVYPDSLSELYDVMKMQAKLFNKEKKIDLVIKEMERIFNIVKTRVAKVPLEKRKKVLWIGGKPTSVSCGIGITNDLFQMMNAKNVAGHINQRNVEVSMEQIVAWNPDIVFIWGNAKYGETDILENPQWQHIKAVKNKMVYKSPKWSTWSPRLAIVALWMAMRTYPEYFSDINFEKMADDFYKKVFGIPYSKVAKIEN